MHPRNWRVALASCLLLPVFSIACGPKEIKLALKREVEPPKIRSVRIDPAGPIETGVRNTVKVILVGDPGYSAYFDVEGAIQLRQQLMEETESGIYVGTFQVNEGGEGEVRGVGHLIHTPSAARSSKFFKEPLILIPPPPPPQELQQTCTGEMINELDQNLRTITVYFDFNKDVIKAEYRSLLVENLEIISANHLCKIYLFGHADEIGSEQYNFDLSADRAEVVENFLVEALGITPIRLEKHPLGETQPADPGDTEEARALNRRVELRAINPY